MSHHDLSAAYIQRQQHGATQGKPKPGPSPEPAHGDHRTQAEQLIDLAADAELFHTPEGRPYAILPVNGHRETWAIGAAGFRLWLTKRFYDTEAKPPGREGLESALNVLRAQALFKGPEHPVYVRLGQGGDGAIYLDLGTPTWEAVKITVTGWEVVPTSPVRFRRPKGLGALAIPTMGGDLTELLRPLVNLPDDDQWTMFRAWLVTACWPRGPYPVLNIEGEQGAAKSWLARVVRALLDPCVAPLRSAPRSERDLMIAATNSLIVTYDNLSTVPDWLSDALCRLATGGGMGTRELYTDDDEILFDVQRPVVLTGIANLAERDDLRDRAVLLTLPEIPEASRRDEASITAALLERKPLILGALLTAVSTAMRRLPEVRLSRLPRLADFARLATAAEPALGIEPGGFMLVYDASRAEAIVQSIDLNMVAKAVRDFATAETWEGTAADLLAVLTQRVGERVAKAKGWPTTPTSLSSELRRVTPSLRKVGVSVERAKSPDRKRTRLLQIRCADGADDDRTLADGAPETPSASEVPTGQGIGVPADGADGADGDFPLFPGQLSDEEVEERMEREAIELDGAA